MICDCVCSLVLCLPAYLLSTEKVHKRNRSGDGFKGEQGSHGNHSSTSVLQFNNLVTFGLVRIKLLSKTHPVESHITGSFATLTPEVISSVSNRFTFSDGDEHEDGSKHGRLFRSKDTKSLGPVRAFGHTGDVHAKAHSTLVGGPDTSPGKHGHTSVLDLGFLQELLVREHVGEGIEGFASSELSEAHGIPWLATDFLESSGRESRLGGSSL
mmetsp:Transcript_7228/g.10212  ORF Transcript_7228/g.10212 Transcript_7228/m.10212 type:complete len:212 (+) Transcript_7228:265-900(+)